METFKEEYQRVLNNIGGVHGTVVSAEYAANVQEALDKAVKELDSMAAQKSNVEIHYLKGFLAEPWHAGAFNVNAAARGRSDLQAKVPSNNGPADIHYGLKEAQSKYYRNAEATAKALSKAKYDGMTKVVPEDQLEEVKKVARREYLRNKSSRPDVAERYNHTYENATDKLNKDNISGKPISEQQQEEMAKEYKKDGNIDPDKYGLNSENFIKWQDVGRESLEAGAHAAVISAALKMTPYIVEIFKEFHATGKVNLQDLINNKEDILRGTGNAALRGAVAAGVTASLKTGLLGESAKSISPTSIGIATTMAINTIKYAVDLKHGRITKEQVALYCLRDTTVLSFGMVGAHIGQTAVPLPVLGAIVGNLIGSTLGAVVYDGAYQGTLKMCVVSGWTMFGLVEQDYTIPEEHLREMGFDVFNQGSFTTDTFSQGNFPVESFKKNSLSFKPLRRGVVGYNAIGYQ